MKWQLWITLYELLKLLLLGTPTLSDCYPLLVTSDPRLSRPQFSPHNPAGNSRPGRSSDINPATTTLVMPIFNTTLLRQRKIDFPLIFLLNVLIDSLSSASLRSFCQVVPSSVRCWVNKEFIHQDWTWNNFGVITQNIFFCRRHLT